MTTPYSAHKHRHNFATWAAARATQRGFTTTEALTGALESTTISAFVRCPCGPEDFENCHRQWCTGICDHLRRAGISGTTYGRAAKLVNVYLKSMVVLPDPHSEAAEYIHPPVDRILLQTIARDPDVDPTYRRRLRDTNWTQLDQPGYADVIAILDDINGDRPFWKIEEYWQVTS